MISNKAREGIESKTGFVVVMVGSDSDKPHLEKIMGELDKWELPYEVRIASAHKQPSTVEGIIREYNGVGSTYTIIAVAGMTDALSGTASSLSDGPVISCPPDRSNLSCLDSPPGSSNATVLDPRNAARFVVQIYSGCNPGLLERLISSRDSKVDSLVAKDWEFREKY